jgi:hypothetical protein
MNWKSPGSPHSKKVRMSKSKFKIMLICFFHCKAILYWESVLSAQVIQTRFRTSETANSSCEARIFPRQVDPALWHCFPSRSFLAKKSIVVSNTLLTHQIWLHVSSSSSLAWRIVLKYLVWNNGRDSGGYGSHSIKRAEEWHLRALRNLETRLELMYNFRELLWTKIL